jgi:AcrR family transcriptional regulator
MDGRMNPRARSERNRAAILDAAARAIARHGYHGMSMRDLSRACGQGLASLYVHFSSKEDILFALQSEAFDALIASSLRALAQEQGHVARLHAFILNHVRFFMEHPDLMRTLVQEAAALPPEKRGRIRERKERYFETAKRLVTVIVESGCGRPGAMARAGHDEAELERATYALFGMLNWIYGWYEPRRHGPPELLAGTLHRIALCGLVAQCPFRGGSLQAGEHIAAAGGAT